MLRRKMRLTKWLIIGGAISIVFTVSIYFFSRDVEARVYAHECVIDRGSVIREGDDVLSIPDISKEVNISSDDLQDFLDHPDQYSLFSVDIMLYNKSICTAQALVISQNTRHSRIWTSTSACECRLDINSREEVAVRIYVLLKANDMSLDEQESFLQDHFRVDFSYSKSPLPVPYKYFSVSADFPKG